jgi:hypothetical protein
MYEAYVNSRADRTSELWYRELAEFFDFCVIPLATIRDYHAFGFDDEIIWLAPSEPTYHKSGGKPRAKKWCPTRLRRTRTKGRLVDYFRFKRRMIV